jgi:7-keto-8-aminopelargonate synthetase-like enzyme
MSGDLINLPRLVELANEYDASVMVDDAHAVGVMGSNGRGTGEHFGLEADVDLILGTFSKSFAALGGFVVGDEDVIHYIKHTARALIFSASITPGSVAAVLAALDIIENEPERREQLWRNVRKVKAGLDGMGFDTLSSQTPVIPAVVGEDLHTMAFWKELFDSGIYTNPVIPPAVPPNQGLIRISLMATHTEDQLDRMLETFERVGKSMGVI